MLIIGLTGSIATGKSTVANILASPPHKLTIVDADKLARQVVEPGTPGYKKIVAHFGPTTPDLLEDGTGTSTTTQGRPLNRAALGRRVFGQGREADRKTLNGIIHPAVGRALYSRILWAWLRGHWAVVLDIPLLYESGWESFCGAILVVGVSDPEVQMSRLMRRDPHLSEQEARDRVSSQYDVRVKCMRAAARGERWGRVVMNDKDEDALRSEVARAVAVMRESSPWWWTLALWLNPAFGLLIAAWTWIRAKQKKQEWERLHAGTDDKAKTR